MITSMLVFWVSFYLMVAGVTFLLVTTGFHFAGVKPAVWAADAERQRVLVRRQRIASVTVWPTAILMVGGDGLFWLRAYYIVSGGGL